jgi:hypothetical protein
MLLPTAKIFGDIKTPELIIQNGVILEGRCVIANDLKASAKDVIEAEYLKDNLNEGVCCFRKAHAPIKTKPTPANYRFRGLAHIASLNSPSPVIVSQGDAAGAGWFAFKEIIAAHKKFCCRKEGCRMRYDIKRLVVVGDIFDIEAAFLRKTFSHDTLHYSRPKPAAL